MASHVAGRQLSQLLMPLLPDAALPMDAPQVRRVFVHGFTQVPEAWGPVRRRCRHGGVGDILVRLPGHASGRRAAVPLSTAIDAQQPFMRYVHAVADQVAAVTARPLHLIGYSMGARVALAWLTARPEQVALATLIGVQPGLKSAAARQARLAQEAKWLRALAGDDSAAFLRQWAHNPLFASQQAMPAARARQMAAWRARHPAAGLRSCIQRLGLSRMPNLWPALDEVRLPVLFLAGALDATYAEIAAEAAGLSPSGRAACVLGAGHNIGWEAPSLTADLIDGWQCKLIPA